MPAQNHVGLLGIRRFSTVLVLHDANRSSAVRDGGTRRRVEALVDRQGLGEAVTSSGPLRADDTDQQDSAKYWRNSPDSCRFSNQPVAEIVQCGEPFS